jgi:GNAT superfamily N-acetyltransferase
VVAARRNRLLVGFALLFIDTEECGADLNDLAVRSNQQRAGVGYAVCAEAVAWMSELACREITGWAVHPGSQRIFDRLGFAPHPSLPGSVLYVG